MEQELKNDDDIGTACQAISEIRWHCSSVRMNMNMKIVFDIFEAERLRPRNEVTNLTLSIRDNVRR